MSSFFSCSIPVIYREAIPAAVPVFTRILHRQSTTKVCRSKQTSSNLPYFRKEKFGITHKVSFPKKRIISIPNTNYLTKQASQTKSFHTTSFLKLDKIKTCTTSPAFSLDHREYSTKAETLRMVPPVKPQSFTYPEVRRDESVQDNYHETIISDPYRWLEDPDSEETRQFVQDQNNLTIPYLESCSVREKLRNRLTQLWNYEKYSCPSKRGNRYYFFKNTGLQNQSVLYTQKTLDDEPTVFFDPNALAEDGTIAISTYKFSENGEIFAYGLSKSGSDWMTVHFKNTSTGQDYSDLLEKVKYTHLTWTHDNLGIFYARYPDQEGKTDGSETTSSENQKLYYHRIGTPQTDDTLMVEFPQNPKWMIGAEVTNCGNYLIVLPQEECRDNLVYYASLIEPIKNNLKEPLQLTQVVTKFEADYAYVTNDGSEMIFRTNKNAPNYRLIKIDFNNPVEEAWTTLVAQHEKNVLDWATAVNNDKVVLCYINDVKNTLELHELGDGSYIQDFPIELGTITAFSGKREHSEVFFQFSSFLTPGRIYRIDFHKKPWEAVVLREIKLKGVDTTKFTTTQVFFPSKDGTKIPMFIVHNKELQLDGTHPCLLYAYGGFNISIQPTFSITRLVYMLHVNGIIAEANIRGGGEYGENWHNAGRLHNKQNCFDDFQAAGEFLVQNKYTSCKKLAIQGGSNGGLLVGACVNQRPDLFGAGIAQVGVMDMLRFHKFTIGYTWASDYGSSDSKDHFHTLLKYSPLHNVKVPEQADRQYPALLLLTADHDDRVVPCHSFKLIAEIQHRLKDHPSQTNPLLIRIDTKAGHGAGKPTAKIIEEHTDILCFMIRAMGHQVHEL